MAVPELQKLLTFQHGNEGVGAMLALNDLGRDQPLTLANDKAVETNRSKPVATSSHKYVRQNLAVGDGLTGFRVLQILNAQVNHEFVDI